MKAPLLPRLLLLASLVVAGAHAAETRLDGLVLPFREVVVASPVQSVIVKIIARARR